MNYFMHLAHPWLALFGAGILVAAVIWRARFYQQPSYVFALAGLMKSEGYDAGFWRNHVLTGLRFLTLALLVFLLGRPQLVDVDSTVRVEGIDIVMALDVSDSMSLFDDLQDKRPRIAVAVEEAKRFIDKRENDQIGLVLFAADAVARLPLTLDKDPIKDVLDELQLGIINSDGTFLMTGIATAANRLKHSKAKSKIIILLTDGAPTYGDIDMQIAMDIANKVGVKIYTIGIGSPEGGITRDPRFGLLRVGAPLNEDLLQEIAKRTGGRYFAAHKPKDMKKIYETIDKLERAEIEAPLYSNYYELGIPLLLVVLALLLIELLLRFFVWKSL